MSTVDVTRLAYSRQACRPDYVGKILDGIAGAFGTSSIDANDPERPCGLSAARLPIGVQIIGRAFEEEKVLRAAYAYEQATEWHKKRPGLSW